MCQREKDIREMHERDEKENKRLLKKAMGKTKRKKKIPLDCFGLGYLKEEHYTKGKIT